MAGVAGPLARRDRGAAGRFMVGLTAGYLSAGILVGSVLTAMGLVASATLTLAERIGVVALLCIGFMILDAVDRTPQLSRQVPVQLYRVLGPGPLGFTWGFDLGLLITTRKTSSLLWMVLLTISILQPMWVAPSVILFALASVSIILHRSILPADLSLLSRRRGVGRFWSLALMPITGVVVAMASIAR